MALPQGHDTHPLSHSCLTDKKTTANQCKMGNYHKPNEPKPIAKINSQISKNQYFSDTKINISVSQKSIFWWASKSIANENENGPKSRIWGKINSHFNISNLLGSWFPRRKKSRLEPLGKLRRASSALEVELDCSCIRHPSHAMIRKVTAAQGVSDFVSSRPSSLRLGCNRWRQPLYSAEHKS